MPSFDISIDVDFEVYCATCGAGLCNQSGTEHRRNRNIVNVEVCQSCLDKAKTEGYDEGYKKGFEAGESQ